MSKLIKDPGVEEAILKAAARLGGVNNNLLHWRIDSKQVGHKSLDDG
jgi:hypothetical protein